jgi:hypothetical protein
MGVEASILTSLAGARQREHVCDEVTYMFIKDGHSYAADR